jgi:TonB family protein
MRDAKIAESSAQLLDEPQVEANQQDDQLPDETFDQTMSGVTSQRVTEPATQRLAEAETEPLAEVPGQAQVAESPTEPLSPASALKRELHREKQLADTAQDLGTESPSQTGMGDAGEPYNQFELVNTGTDILDETPTRPLSQFSAELLDDAPTQSLSELFAEAELRDTLGKEKLGEPLASQRLGDQGALPPSAAETNFNALDSGAAIKQCPVCHKIYKPTESYCAHDAARLVHGPVAPESEFPSRAAPRKGHAFLWVMMAVLVLAGIPVAYLLMSKRPADPRAATTVPGETKVVTPTVEPTEVKSSPIVEGAIKGSEVSVPEPEYPEVARNQGISGSITVAIIVSRGGKVVGTRASAGPELLRKAAKAAARNALFTSQQGPQRSGSITYYFGKVSSGLVPEISIPHPGKRTETPEIVQYPLVKGGIKGSEIIVPEADYPAAAKRRWLSGLITVSVKVSSEGKVIAARSSKGSRLLRSAAESAARKALFKPQPGPSRSGTITYHLGPLGQS